MNIKFQKEELFKKYDVQPDKIRVAGELKNKSDKEILIYYLIKGFEFARNNSKAGNITASSYCAAAVFDNYEACFGVNLNNTRNEISSICAERSALIAAYNKKIENFKSGNNGFKINYILINSYKKDGQFWADKITPCADCLAWLNVDSMLSSECRVVSLKKENGELYIDILPLASFLPLRNEVHKIVDDFSSVSVIKSDFANSLSFKDEDLINLYKKAYFEYKNNILADTSGQNIAVAIIANGEIFTGVKIDFSKRWFIDPLLQAASRAIEKYKGGTKIEAVCYAGDDYTVTETGIKNFDGLINIKTLGRLNTKFANSKTLVITGTKSGITVRTIGDYLPEEHRFVHSYEIK